MNKYFHKPDYLLMFTIIGLVLFGLFMVSSASVVQSYEATGSNNFYLIRQGIFAAVGLVLFLIVQKIDYHYWRRYARNFLLFALVLGVLVLIPGIGVNIGGARRWFDLGFATLQVTEVIKLATVVYLAFWLEKIGNNINDFKRGFLPFIGTLAGIGLLVMLEPDLGTMVVIAFIALSMYLVSGVSMMQVGTLVIIGLSAVWALIQAAPYRLRRFQVFLDPSQDPLGVGYHINQALLAVGSGGLFGLGFGQSRQKYNYLPQVSSDSIFAVIAEELGFIRSVIMIFVFFWMILRGIEIARLAPDRFGRLLATGIVGWIGFQTVVNVSAIIGLFPMTGVPLPFISSGGSALVITMVAAGILVNISRQTKRRSHDEGFTSWWWHWRTRRPATRRRERASQEDA